MSDKLLNHDQIGNRPGNVLLPIVFRRYRGWQLSDHRHLTSDD